MSADRAENHFDAIIVGSGATGGVAAMELTRAGFKVLLLEAGRAVDPQSDIESRPPWNREKNIELPRQPIQSISFDCDHRNSHLYVDDMDNPYTYPEHLPFHWMRSRIFGGRTLAWGRACLRFTPQDFIAASVDGVGENWPITYAELSPYYKKIEELIGIGACDLLQNEFTLGAFAKSFYDRFRQQWPDRYLVPYPVCANDTNFGGTNVFGAFPRSSSVGSSMLLAAESGNLSIRYNAIVASVSEKDGMADGVLYIDGNTGALHKAKASLVVLCASTIESVRLLLNSKSNRFPDGIGNSNGLLGHYFMDHINASCRGYLKDDNAILIQNTPQEQFYVPSFKRKGNAKANEYIRDFASLFSSFYDEKLTKESWFYGVFFGEVLPDFKNRISLDPERKDKWGIPVAHLELGYGSNELKIFQAGSSFLEEVCSSLEVRLLYQDTKPKPPGSSIHELGGARMGADPRTSVLNAFNQCWDMKNLFVLDGACFTSSPPQSPTLTMMAIASRASDFIIKEKDKKAWS